MCMESDQVLMHPEDFLPLHLFVLCIISTLNKNLYMDF